MFAAHSANSGFADCVRLSHGKGIVHTRNDAVIFDFLYKLSAPIESPYSYAP